MPPAPPPPSVLLIPDFGALAVAWSVAGLAVLLIVLLGSRLLTGLRRVWAAGSRWKTALTVLAVVASSVVLSNSIVIADTLASFRQLTPPGAAGAFGEHVSWARAVVVFAIATALVSTIAWVALALARNVETRERLRFGLMVACLYQSAQPETLTLSLRMTAGGTDALYLMSYLPWVAIWLVAFFVSAATFNATSKQTAVVEQSPI